MVLSAALDSGYVFMALVAILTSVISAVYYLNIIKQIFFDQPDYKINEEIRTLNFPGNIMSKEVVLDKFTFKAEDIILSSPLTITISILSLVILLFMFNPEEWLSMANILALIIFNT
jgi:NADH-ubiquinone oxidoreductase chain 2